MNFEHCIRCTVCVENCPVFRVNPAFPGPKQSGPDAQRFRSDREKTVDDWVLLCSQCKRCEMACPYGVEPAQIILKAQQRYGMEHSHTASHLLFANNYYLSSFGSLTAPIANRIAATKVGKKFFNALGIATYISFPKFSPWKLQNEKKVQGRSANKVAFFYGCFINFWPDIGRKIMKLLNALQVEVVLPPQWCCGLPALGNGNLALARSFALKNAASLSKYIDAGYDIVYTCTSCGLCLHEDYQDILKIPQAGKIVEHSYNLHEYLLRFFAISKSKTNFKEVRLKLAYHIPCHLRALKIGYPAAKLMNMVPGLKYEVLDDACCGLSGSYGFKKSNEATAVQLGARAVSLIKKTGAEAIVADCGSCRLQLGGMSHIPVFDPSEILCEALGMRE